MNGIINFRKPAEMTSHDAVRIVRRLTGIRRVGHTGTLDPMATGVLPICVGSATRIIEFMDADRNPEAKSYRCAMTLGLVSDTQDIWGAVTRNADPSDLPGERAVREALKSMEGARTQRTPLYSAAKYKGTPLYAYARAGASLPEEALKERDIYIKSISVNYVDLARSLVLFDMDCSSGTYVRTICHDVGQQLGCGAVMSGLMRTRSCGFLLEDSHTPDRLEAMRGDLPILPTDSALTDLPTVVLDREAARVFRNGGRIGFRAAPGSLPDGLTRVYEGRRFIGIGNCADDLLNPRKVIDDGEAQS
jgi:tRNA pseudouridine55 synthase